MIAFNFTLVTEMVLFLVFLWVTNRFIFRPLLRVMDERQAKLNQDQAAADSDISEAQCLETLYVERLTAADQGAAQHLRQARYDAYQRNRAELDELRKQVDAQVAEFRENVQRQVAEERQKYAGLIPGLVEAVDQQMRTGGTLR